MMRGWKKKKLERMPAMVVVPSITLFGKTKNEDTARCNLFLDAEKLGASISVDHDNQCVMFNFDNEQNARHFVDIAKKTIIYRTRMEVAE